MQLYRSFSLTITQIFGAFGTRPVYTLAHISFWAVVVAMGTMIAPRILYSLSLIAFAEWKKSYLKLLTFAQYPVFSMLDVELAHCFILLCNTH